MGGPHDRPGGWENAASGAEAPQAGKPLAPFRTERLLTLAEEGLDVYLVQVGSMNSVTEREGVPRQALDPGPGGATVALIPEELASRPSLLRLEEGVELLRLIFFGRKDDRLKFCRSGVGPGDPELVTLKALKVLRRLTGCSFHCLPGAAERGRGIMAAHLTRRPSTLLFPMVKDGLCRDGGPREELRRTRSLWEGASTLAMP